MFPVVHQPTTHYKGCIFSKFHDSNYQIHVVISKAYMDENLVEGTSKEYSNETLTMPVHLT